MADCAAKILASDDMIDGDAFAELLGMTRAAVDAKRQSDHLFGLDGADIGYRFPTWQLDSEGKPYAALPKLFELLGQSSWAVYRFLTSSHNEFRGRTGLEVLRKAERQRHWTWQNRSRAAISVNNDCSALWWISPKNSQIR